MITALPLELWLEQRDKFDKGVDWVFEGLNGDRHMFSFEYELGFLLYSFSLGIL